MDQIRFTRRRKRFYLLAVLLFIIPRAAAAQSITPDLITLAHVRSKASAELRTLPDYVCAQTFERARRPSKELEFRPLDKALAEVAHVGGKDVYSRVGGRELGDVTLDGMLLTGMVETGTFGSYAKTLFMGSAAVFMYRGVEVAGSRRLLRFDYRISALQSGFVLSGGARKETVAEKGSFWAEALTGEIVRIRAEADQIPADLGITSASVDIEYGRFAEVGNALLPVRADVHMQRTTGEESRNVSTFAGCRRYRAESALSFDVSDEPVRLQPPAASTLTPRTFPNRVQTILPAGLGLRLELETSIDSRSSKPGDEVRARLIADATAAGSVVVPAGAIARGLLRVFERARTKNPVWVVVLDFTEVSFGDTLSHLTAILQTFEEGGTIRRVHRFIDPPGNTGIPGAPGFPGGEEVVTAPEVQSGGAFLVRGSRARVPRGFRMTFRTIKRS